VIQENITKRTILRIKITRKKGRIIIIRKRIILTMVYQSLLKPGGKCPVKRKGTG
jgi:hypothetical protein